jgi:hypothetical protein
MLREPEPCQSHASRHCGRHLQRRVDADEVVVEEVQRHRIGVVLDRFAERVRQSRHAARVHPDVQVVPLGIRRADVARIGSPSIRCSMMPGNGGAVAAFGALRTPLDCGQSRGEKGRGADENRAAPTAARLTQDFATSPRDPRRAPLPCQERAQSNRARSARLTSCRRDSRRVPARRPATRLTHPSPASPGGQALPQVAVDQSNA